MSIIDRIFIGNVIKDFGALEERSLGIGKIKTSALLVEKYGRLYFVIKSSAWAFLGGSIHYQDFTLEQAGQLRELINASEQIAQNFPPVSYDVNRVSVRNSLIALFVALAINLLAQNDGLTFVATVVATVVHLNQFIEFTNHPNIDTRTKTWLLLAPVFTIVIGVAKIVWLNVAK